MLSAFPAVDLTSSQILLDKNDVMQALRSDWSADYFDVTNLAMQCVPRDCSKQNKTQSNKSFLELNRTNRTELNAERNEVLVFGIYIFEEKH